MGVVALTGFAPTWGPENIGPVTNRLREQFDQIGISRLVKAAGPFMNFYEENHQITVHVALPVAELPAELPSPAEYIVLPEVEAVTAVRKGPSSNIFPMIYDDLFGWVNEHGYQAAGPGRDIWVTEVDDIAKVAQQVVEVQLPFTRP